MKKKSKPADAPRRGKPRVIVAPGTLNAAISKTRREPRAEPSTQSPAPAPAPTAPAAAAQPVTSITSRISRANLSPAARRGLDCVKYLRIHLRRPYAVRGQAAIVKIAVEAAHLGLAELAANGADATGNR